MSQSLVRYVVAACILFPSAGVSLAQPAPGHDAWLMRNYRFTGPPKPSELVPVAPVLMELREIQSSPFLGRSTAMRSEWFPQKPISAIQTKGPTRWFPTSMMY